MYIWGYWYVSQQSWFQLGHPAQHFTCFTLRMMDIHIWCMLLIFLPTVLILACDSSSPAFHMMYSTCDGHEFEQALRVGDGSLACYSPWGHKESETQLSDWTELNSAYKLNKQGDNIHTALMHSLTFECFQFYHYIKEGYTEGCRQWREVWLEEDTYRAKISYFIMGHKHVNFY